MFGITDKFIIVDLLAVNAESLMVKIEENGGKDAVGDKIVEILSKFLTIGGKYQMTEVLGENIVSKNEVIIDNFLYDGIEGAYFPQPFPIVDIFCTNIESQSKSTINILEGGSIIMLDLTKQILSITCNDHFSGTPQGLENELSVYVFEKVV